MKLLKKDQCSFKVVEIFKSVEGEGKWVGLPAVFIRLEGCNLRCSWCDTTYSYDGKTYTELSKGDILDRVKKYNTKRVCITGGEPFFNENIDILIESLIEEDFTVFIQTNGTLWNDGLERINLEKVYITCSPKPPLYFIHKKLIPFINELKFVIDSTIKLSDILKKELEVLIHKDSIILQPESNKKEMVEKALYFQEELLKIGIESRVIPQCHKILNLP